MVLLISRFLNCKRKQLTIVLVKAMVTATRSRSCNFSGRTNLPCLFTHNTNFIFSAAFSYRAAVDRFAHLPVSRGCPPLSRMSYPFGLTAPLTPKSTNGLNRMQNSASWLGAKATLNPNTSCWNLKTFAGWRLPLIVPLTNWLMLYWLMQLGFCSPQTLQ